MRRHSQIGDRVLRHRCNPGCFKKGPLCRYNFPRPVVQDTVIDTNIGFITMRQRDALVSPHTPDVTTTVGGNNNMDFLLTGEAVLPRLHYQSKYMSKSTPLCDRVYAIALAQKQIDARFGNRSDTEALDTRRFIAACCNRLGAETEIPAVAAAFYILYNRDHFSYDTFSPLYLGLFLSRVSTLEAPARTAGEDEDEHAMDFETTALARDAEGQIVEHNQVDDYLCRPHELSDVCLYLFVARFWVAKTSASPVSSGRSAPRSTGRPRTARHHFLPSHPRSNTHLLREREEPVVPRIAGRSVPRRDHPNPAIQELYAKIILVLFKPWTCLSDLRDADKTWTDALARFQPPPLVARYIDNLQLLHRMKEDAAREREIRAARGLVSGGWDRVLERADVVEMGEPDEEHDAMAQAVEASTLVERHEDPHVASAIEILEQVGFFQVWFFVVLCLHPLTRFSRSHSHRPRPRPHPRPSSTRTLRHRPLCSTSLQSLASAPRTSSR